MRSMCKRMRISFVNIGRGGARVRPLASGDWQNIGLRDQDLLFACLLFICSLFEACNTTTPHETTDMAFPLLALWLDREFGCRVSMEMHHEYIIVWCISCICPERAWYATFEPFPFHLPICQVTSFLPQFYLFPQNLHGAVKLPLTNTTSTAA